MKVSELIAKLSEMPGDLDVSLLWDGCARGSAEFVWLAPGEGEFASFPEDRGPYVVVGGANEVVYYDCDRPADAPRQADQPYWCTPRLPVDE